MLDLEAVVSDAVPVVVCGVSHAPIARATRATKKMRFINSLLN